jgi:hypothetical protein
MHKFFIELRDGKEGISHRSKIVSKKSKNFANWNIICFRRKHISKKEGKNDHQ